MTATASTDIGDTMAADVSAAIAARLNLIENAINAFTTPDC